MRRKWRSPMSEMGHTLVHGRSPSFYPSFFRKSELPHQTHYCPGCGHGVIHKLVAEALDGLAVQDRTVLVSPVGCSVFAYYYVDVGNIQAAHGRASAVATAAKRARPASIVLSYQGDGDMTAIGYCPGCGHGVIHKLIAQAIDKLALQDRTVLVSPVRS